ncbi:50S ribosomal protein L9 [Akkermansia sp. N21169]|jgi:large subunit ribosomal protein L9|uniref:50S ribosomal protein L9 n=1 Tax=unclassified Akkermansia TaxID=2608915 RepID=UPI00244ECE1A|nr:MULTISPECIES: 50S ribosomal protein L9 [unclassified Akkermansia]MDH3067790.1 50S ribosomal protein L9 [Akkermansia sp. N21169]WPX41078.1 50S ribosomal protein L9 [Akkermansia sp. N21116]
MATMEVILATKIEGLGAEADLVTVKAGYGRNCLIPKGLAYEATNSNKRFITSLKAKRAEREAAEKAAAEEVAKKINALSLDLNLESGQDGKTFGAITNHNIQEALAAKGVEIDRRMIDIEKPIKQGGLHEVSVKLHTQVTAILKVNVKVEGAENAPAPAPEAAAE